MQLNTRVKRLLIGLIPCVAALVAARQWYLSSHSELSTWKGGGMGMFASADSSDTRFLRLFIETDSGAREPIIGLTAKQQQIVERILWFPSDEAFTPLAQSLRQTSFVAPEDGRPLNSFSLTGERIAKLNKQHHLLHANRVKRDGPPPDWTLVCEYYRLTYDPATRVAKFSLVKTLRFGKETT